MNANVRRYVALPTASRWRAVPRTERSEGRGVFALVVRCRIIRLVVYSRVGKNPRQVGAGCDTRREPPAAAGAGLTASHKTVLFSQKALAVRKAIAYPALLAAGGVFKCDKKCFWCHYR
jgi:hypothetical protein